MQEITIQQALALSNTVFVDVRSPGEFAEASIPGAINLPLLDDEERAKVGTVYKQIGPEQARFLGVDVVSPKLSQLMGELRELAKQGQIIVFCWRGGMRSKAMCQFAQLVDLPVARLSGGYKAYRRYINEFMQAPELTSRAIVLDGNTGVGKTEMLDRLAELGVGVVDLEGLANNRGSVFGNVGLGGQPSQKAFDSGLVDALLKPECSTRFVVECESKRIGRLMVPDIVVRAMAEGEHVLLYGSIEKRVERLVNLYCSNPDYKPELCKAVEAIASRLGRAKAEELKILIQEGDYAPCVEYLLVYYYDPLYRYPHEPTGDYRLAVCTDDMEAAAQQLAKYILAQ
ncbi:MAG TPA: tRNA 2-selenouridine(34) synthase MnmH [Bacillota bacterium]|nr:tRNA 2-selenouridine(34) synthase MnmH [Bacillota bacterium]